jgi:uncharacterized membrane protein
LKPDLEEGVRVMILYIGSKGSANSNSESVSKLSVETLRTLLVRAKIGGAIGSILLTLSIVPYFGIIFGTVGFIFILFSARLFSQILGNKSIFKYMCIAIIFGILGVSVEAGLLFPSLSTYIRTTCMSCPVARTSLYMVLFLLSTWVLTLLSAIFMRKSLKSIDSGFGVRRLSIAALLYLIGAMLLFNATGFLIVLVAQVVLAIAFTLMPRQMSGAPPPLSQQSQTN